MRFAHFHSRFTRPVIVAVILLTSVLAFAEIEKEKVDFSVFEGPNYICEVQGLIGDDTHKTTDLNAQDFLKCLDKTLPAERVSALKNQWKDLLWLNAAVVRAADLRVTVVTSEFKVLIHLSKHEVIATQTSIQNQSSLDLKPTPALYPWASGYLNYSLSEVGTYSGGSRTSEAGFTHSRQYSLNPVVSLWGTVMESYHRTAADSTELKRIETFSITDFEKSFTRLRVGDSFSPTSSLVDQFRFLGVSVNRNYLYSENFINRPLGEREIFLERPARVEVYVNFVLVSSLSLQPGRHIIEDIPTNQGINSVVLRITETSGEVRTVVFQTAVEDSLFRKGYSDFSFNVGQLNTGLAEVTYSNEVAGSAIYRYGLTNQLTLGSTLAFKQALGIAGVDGTFATTKGIFKLELAGSKGESESGSGARLSYSWICNCAVVGRDQRFNLGVESYSENFVRQLAATVINPPSIRHGVFSSYAQSLNRTASIRVSAAFNKSFASDRLLYSGSMEYNRNISNQFLVSLRYANSLFDTVTASVHEIGVQLIYRFASGLSSATANSSIVSRGSSRSRIGANYSDPFKYETALGEVAIDGGETQADFQASKGFEHLDLGVQTTVTDNSDRFHQRFAINPAGSILFGGSHVGFGRFIRDSYILFLNETDRTVYLNGSDQTNEATIRPGRMSVITNTQAYRTKTIALSSSGENIYDSQEALLRLKPKYKSALIFEQKQIYNVWLSGKLVDKAGESIGMSAGTMTCGSAAPVAFFTDTDGTFLIQTAGEACTLLVDSRPFEIGHVAASALNDGVTDLGIVALKANATGD